MFFRIAIPHIYIFPSCLKSSTNDTTYISVIDLVFFDLISWAVYLLRIRDTEPPFKDWLTPYSISKTVRGWRWNFNTLPIPVISATAVDVCQYKSRSCVLKWTSTNAVGIVTCTKLSILCTFNINSTVSVAHLIYFTLPERDNMDYNLRPRYNDRQLIRKSAYISNSLCIVRMLYKDSYWLCWFILFYNLFYLLYSCCDVSTRFLNEYMDMDGSPLPRQCCIWYILGSLYENIGYRKRIARRHSLSQKVWTYRRGVTIFFAYRSTLWWATWWPLHKVDFHPVRSRCKICLLYTSYQVGVCY